MQIKDFLHTNKAIISGWGIWIILFIVLGILLFGCSTIMAATIDLPCKDGTKVTAILPNDVPSDLTSKYLKVICSKTHNLCILRIFYVPEENFQRNPYLHFYDFVVFKDKKIVLGVIQYLNGNERYWKYETKQPEEITLEEFKKYIDRMLSIKHPNSKEI